MKQTIQILTAIILFVAMTSCNQDKSSSMGEEYAVKMGNTILSKYPKIWMIENSPAMKWTYTHGLVASALLDLYDYTNDERYLDYVEDFADTIVLDGGIIQTYKLKEYNIDKINSGKMLLRLYKITGKEKYRMAADTLRKQLDSHPTTEIGGFWHKERYPHQMWLDGLYMGGPFLAEYAAAAGDRAAMDYTVMWFINMEKVSRDPNTGLLYHGWDESREQAWSDSITGCSPNFWGRGMGWYGMALVDVLDFIPAEQPARDEVIAIVQRMAEAIIKVQDPETGIWYQVLDQGDREGNYLEGSVSSMFSYFLLKAVNMGYLDKNAYGEAAKKAFEGTVANLITENEDGTITLSPVCAVAGLGGSPYRDGSYEYYINERQRDNDPKAVGPFIMAGIQYDIMVK